MRNKFDGIRRHVSAPSRLSPASIPSATATSSPNIEQLIDGEGQITNGAIHPLRCVTIANDGHNSLAMPVRHDGKTLAQLLIRLDAAIAKAYDEDTRLPTR